MTFKTPFLSLILYIVLVSLDGSSPNLEVPSYPGTSGFPAALSYNDGQVLACGGLDLADSTKCWVFDGSKWSPLPDSAPHCWFETTTTVVDGKWWLTGRVQTGDNGCAEDWISEVFNGDEWVPGPEHPTGYSQYSCTVQLNTTHSLYTGGDPTKGQTWLYDWTSKTWTESGGLHVHRYAHGCVVLNDQAVLVAGGEKAFADYVMSVERYNPLQGKVIQSKLHQSKNK